MIPASENPGPTSYSVTLRLTPEEIQRLERARERAGIGRARPSRSAMAREALARGLAGLEEKLP
jgi:hypothetical protein